jgi:hypothetical protein
MHEFGADGSTVDTASLLGESAISPQFGMRDVGQKAERVEISFQVSPMTERVENALAVAVGIFQNSGEGGFTSSLSSGGHISTTRITDEAGYVLDSPV